MKRFKSVIALLLLLAVSVQAQVQSNTDVYNIRTDFGAVGDGTADDSQALQTAFETVPTGSTIFFPAGTYLCGSNWSVYTLAKDLKLVGEDGSLLVGPTAEATASNFIDLTEGYDLTLDNLGFRYFHGVIQLQANTTTDHETVIVRNCDFDGTYYPVYDAGGAGQNNEIQRFEFVGNRVHATSRAPKRGLVVRFVNHYHVLINENYFTGIENGDIAAAVWVGSESTTGGESCIVTQNFIDGVTCTNADQDTHGIFLYTAICNVSHNVVKNIANANNGQNSEGIYVKSACPMIADNYLEDAGSEAYIYFKGALSSITKGGVITGNTCRLVDGTLATVGGRGGYGISTTNPCIIADNDIDGLLGGVFVTGVSGAIITGNKITNLAGTTESLHGIRIEDTGDIVVSGNVINGIVSSGGAAVYGIRVRRATAGTSSNIAIKANIISTGTSSGSAEMGIGLQSGSGSVLDAVSITENQFDDWDQGVDIIAGQANVTNLVTNDNVFLNCTVGYDPALANVTSHSLALTATDQDTTPSVSLLVDDGLLVFANTGSTTVTNFDDGHEGQHINILITDTNTVIADGATIELDTNANFNPAGRASMSFIYYDSAWHEIGRATY